MQTFRFPFAYILITTLFELVDINTNNHHTAFVFLIDLVFQRLLQVSRSPKASKDEPLVIADDKHFTRYLPLHT